MTALELLIAVQALSAVAVVALLAWCLGVVRESTRLHREALEAASRAARSQHEAAEVVRATVESAWRVQELAARPVLRFGWEVRGRVPDVGHSPVVFAACVTNVGHGTAVIERVQISTHGTLRLDYTRAEGADLADLEAAFDREVFQRIVGTGLETLSAHLTLAPLGDDTRALEVGGRLDLVRVRLYAHQAELLEGGLQAASVNVVYRSLAGARFESGEQFADLQDRT